MEIVYQDKTTYVQTAGYGLDPAKPSVCFLHGAGMDHAVWTLFVRHFARNGYNAIAPDLRGHGRSGGEPLTSIEACAQWLLGLFDALKLGSVAVAGHSMGSLVTLQAAADGGERVRAIALLGFGYPMAVGAPLLDAARANDHAAVDMMTIWGHDFGAQIGGHQVPGLSITNVTKRRLEAARPGVIYADLNACHGYTGGEAAAAKIQCPVTLILGDRDRMTPVRGAREFAKRFARASVDMIPACGHGMMEEKPEQTHQALVRALAV
jgi:pimeloyl-ACP methyl ester carboxylesterase